jgi:Ni,Fe-hydrogenase I small subunit
MIKKLTRRSFVKKMLYGSISMPFLIEMLSRELTAEEGQPQQSIIWLQGHGSEVHRSGIWSYPGFHSYLAGHFNVISTESPDLHSIAIEISGEDRPHILILDGYFSSDLDDPINSLLKDLIVVSRAVILLGNEAAYSAAKPDGFLNLETELLHLVETPYFKLPGNPVPIRHLVGALNHMILYDLPELDELRRPLMFYSQTICDQCQFRGDFEKGNFVRYFGQKKGCLYWLGCKGPVTRNSCAVEKWNGTTTWCIDAGSPCSGCSEPGYPDHGGLGIYGQLVSDNAPINSMFVRNASTIAQGAFAVTLAGVAVHAISRKTSAPLKDESVFYLEESDHE